MRSLLIDRRAWQMAFLALLLQIAAPLLALDAMADHEPYAPICGGDHTPAHPSDLLCPACQFCAAVQPVMAPAPLATPMPSEAKRPPPARFADIVGAGAPAIIANARAPPAAEPAAA